MPKLIIFCDNRGPTYQISFQSPLLNQGYIDKSDFVALSQEETELLLSTKLLKWSIKKMLSPQLEACIFSRFGSSHSLGILNQFKSFNIPTINHLDDYLLDAPKDLGQEIHQRLNQTAVIKARKDLIEHSDLNYISTNYLRCKLEKEFPNSHFYSGIYATYKELSLFKCKPQENQTFKIGYMASKGHTRDLSLIIDDLEKVLLNFPNVTIDFFGSISPPKTLKENFPDRVSHIKGTPNYSDFLIKLKSLHWDVGVIPLKDDEWNRCKAPTKFIEYTSAGIPVIASDICVYNTVASNNKEISLIKNHCWYETISYLIKSPDAKNQLIQNATKLCKNDFTIHKLSSQLNRVIRIANERRKS